MTSKTKDQLEYEERLSYRMQILEEKLKEGKVHIADHLEQSFKESFDKIKYDAKGEIILDTVDGRIRSMALAIEGIDTREKLKKQISLSEIQHLYFEFIEQNFKTFFDQMNASSSTPNHIADFLSSNDDFVKEFGAQIHDFVEALFEFWKELGDIGYWHLEDTKDSINGVYGGDLFPKHDENIASKCGIYIDTIILPDPFVRSKHIFEHYPVNKQVFYCIKHAMNILKYKELACADIDTPIVVILPDLLNLEENGRDYIYRLGQDDALIHAQKLFGRSFAEFDEFLDFCKSLDTVEKTCLAIKDKQRVLFDTEWKGSIHEQILRSLHSDEMSIFGKLPPGMVFCQQALGRMSVSNELLLKARQVSGTPIIEAETSWRYFNWKLEYDSERIQKLYSTENLHITKGLTDLSRTDLPWLGNIPPAALIDLRRQGALEEIRDILGNNIHELAQINPTNFFRTRDQILENIESSFASHRKKLEELRDKKWKFAKHDIGSWIVTGSIGIGAALTGTPAWGLAAVMTDQLLDAPKLREIPQRFKDLAKLNNEVKQSPVGMLFKISQK